MWYLRSPAFRRWIEMAVEGATGSHTRAKSGPVLEQLVPIAPAAEQERIVAAIEEQLSRVASADDALASAARRTASLRAVVLARVLDGAFATKRIGDVFEVYVGTTPPRGDQSLWNGGVPWVSSGEVAFRRVRQTRETISREAVGPDRIHPPGTVLLAMIGEGKTRGQAAILDVAAAHNQNSAAIRINPTVAVPEWVYYVLMARYADTRRVGSGNNQPALNKSRVREIEIPLPPLDEQQRVVGDLERQLSLVDALVPAIEHAFVRSELLRRAVLVEAFSGRLAPQDPSDEPASELLARFAAERRAASKPRQRKRA